MKKRVSVKILVVSMLCLVFMSGCDSKIGRTIENIVNPSEIVYQASTRFLYSMDGGVSWSETIQEIPIDTTYYLAVEMQVSQSESSNDEKSVVATITIPSTNVLDCYLDDHPGVSITGKTDAVTNSVSYDFNVVASTSPSKFRVVFECKPLAEGRTKVEVIYDDNVSPDWDATGTIKYVSKSNSDNDLNDNTTDDTQSNTEEADN